MNAREWAESNLIHLIVSGSRLYGTSRPDSDYDHRGVCLMPRTALFGLTGFDQYEDKKNDTTIYGLTKFFVLSLQNNPNIMDVLYAPREVWIINNPYWEMIYNNRDLFLSEKIRHTFRGFGMSQLRRLIGHHQWLTNPPDHQPFVEEFDGWVEKDDKGGQKNAFRSNVDRGRYEKAVANWHQYQTWLNERNPYRAELEKKYGYDTKHASHTVRAMLTAEEALLTGEYHPVLTGDILKVVKEVMDGEWPFEKLVSWAREMDEYILTVPTDLQYSPNRVVAEELLVEINEESLCGKLLSRL